MKKYISLILVFSLLALSVPLTAKDRKGSDLIIQKKDGMELRGELIAVKQDSLLLIDRESGAAVLGLLIGGYIGTVSGKDKTIRVEGKSDSEINKILEKLHKKARVKNVQ